MVTLLATPSANSTFTGWSGGGCTGTGKCVVTMAAAETVTANFALTMYTLTLSTTFYGPAAGSVTSAPAGIATSAAGTTKASYVSGTTVTLTLANPTTLWSWGGACQGTGATCAFTMSADETVNLTVTANNFVFVTSTTYTGDFGGQTAGDALCQGRATAAGLPGTYQAWLSTSTSGAGARLAATGANGWIRVDGLPFTSSVASLTKDFQVYYPPVPEMTTSGNPDFTGYVQTGTSANGTAVSGGTCGDWTSTAGNAGGGSTYAGAGGWTLVELYGCSVPMSLYCFGTDINRPVVVSPATGRRAFVTEGAFNTGSGLAGADALCNTEATNAGLSNPSNFLAFLATATASAASRFDLTGLPWNRTDGIPVADTAADLVNNGPSAAITTHADGTTYTTAALAVTGGASPTTAGTSAQTCINWSSATSAGGSPQFGDPSQANSQFFTLFSSGPSCGTAVAPIYCFDK